VSCAGLRGCAHGQRGITIGAWCAVGGCACQIAAGAAGTTGSVGCAAAGTPGTAVSGSTRVPGFAGRTGSAGRCGVTPGSAGAATGSRRSTLAACAANATTGGHGQAIAVQRGWLTVDAMGVGHGRAATAKAPGAALAHGNRQLDGFGAGGQRGSLAVDHAAGPAAAASSTSWASRGGRYPGAARAGSSPTPTTGSNEQHIG
jgi:hypothetical protein